MRKIVHLSDLHFGRTDHKVVESLTKSIRAQKPDIIIVSGDLTQRAKRIEFEEARKFLNKFSAKKIIIPGNHDIPSYNLLERFIMPFRRYKKYINTNLEPFYKDSQVAILGINTARRFKVKDGSITARQVQMIEDCFSHCDPKLIKILVGHHPFDLPEKFGSGRIIRGATKIMQNIVDAGVDLVLGGHMHISYIGSTTIRYKFEGKAAIVLQAATVSKRTRGEQPSYNIINIDGSKMRLERMVWQNHNHQFEMFFPETFIYQNGLWIKEN